MLQRPCPGVLSIYATAAPQHQTFTARLLVPVVGRRVGHAHSLPNKTVVQLRPKSATRNVFYWSISGTFVFRYDPSANFAV